MLIILSFFLAFVLTSSAVHLHPRMHLPQHTPTPSPKPHLHPRMHLQPLANSNPSTSTHSLERRGINGTWTLVQPGNSGVGGLQLSVVAPNFALIIDKVASNPLQIGNHSAWAALYNLQTNTPRALSLKSNSFCAGGTTLSNGTTVNVGGNGIVYPENGDYNGEQAIRLFGPCTDAAGTGPYCAIYEDTVNMQLASYRWYPTTTRISDGSAIIVGGAIGGGFLNFPGLNNPTLEFFPKKNGGAQVQLPFLVNTLPANLFPHVFALPDGTVFMAANNQTMIYNWKTDTQTMLPQLPNGVRCSYPFSAGATLLPMVGPNYIPEVLICGGSNSSDTVDLSGYSYSAQDPTSTQCARMAMTPAGIAAGWQLEQMPFGRTMGDMVHLPNGQILILNGAMTGYAGYGNVHDQIGFSNADNPAVQALLYTPSAPSGKRFSSSGIPPSTIPRMYHSVASLTSQGNIMIAGSNPNADVSPYKYGSEYRVEYLNPPWMNVQRPILNDTLGTGLHYNQQFQKNIVIPPGMNVTNAGLQVALMDFGFSTHATHPDMRTVFLKAYFSLNNTAIVIFGPPNATVYPPGPGWMFICMNDVCGTGYKFLVGNTPGAAPPVAS